MARFLLAPFSSKEDVANLLSFAFRVVYICVCMCVVCCSRLCVSGLTTGSEVVLVTRTRTRTRTVFGISIAHANSVSNRLRKVLPEYWKAYRSHQMTVQVRLPSLQPHGERHARYIYHI